MSRQPFSPQGRARQIEGSANQDPVAGGGLFQRVFERAGGRGREARTAGGGGQSFRRRACGSSGQIDGNEAFRNLREGSDESLRVLAGLHRADHAQGLSARQLRGGGRQSRAGRGIVAAVDPEFPAFRQRRRQATAGKPLKPGRPNRAGEAGGEDVPPEGVGTPAPHGGRRDSGVDHLVRTAQRRLRKGELRAGVAERHAGFGRLDRPVAAGRKQRRGDLGRARFDGRERVGRLRSRDAGRSRLEDAGLLECDFFPGVSEKAGVIDRHRRDHGDGGGGDRVGGIEPSAEAGFQKQQVRRTPREREKGRGRRDLEKRDGSAAVRRLALFEEVEKRFLGNGAAVERDAFVKPDEMRRRVGVHGKPRRFGDRPHERDGGSLAVGSGDVDRRRQAILRPAEGREQALGSGQRQIDQLGMQRRQPVEDGVTRRRHPRPRRFPQTAPFAPAGRGCAPAYRATPTLAPPCRSFRVPADARPAESPPEASRESFPR